MKLFIFNIILFSFLVGCKSVKNVSTPQKKIPAIKKVDLSFTDQRKFDYFFYEAQRFKMQGQLDKAKMYFLECLKIDSLSSTCFYELANLEIAKNNYKSAQQLLENAVELSPDNKWYYMLLGDLYQQNKNIPKSIEIYESLVLKYPDNEEYIYVLAQLYSNNQQLEEAINTYNKLEKNIGINEMVSLEKQKLYLNLGKKSQAYKEIENLVKENPYDPKYYGYLGDVYMYTNNLDKAEESYKKVFDLDPDNGLGYFSLANVSLQRKDTTRFFEYYIKGVADSNLDIKIKVQRILPILMDNSFKSSHKYVNDIEAIFNQLINTHADDHRSYIYYANYLQTNNKKQLALTYYQKSLEIDKSDPSVWQEMLLLELNNQDFHLILKDSNEAVLLFPEVPLFSFINGMAYMQLKDNTNALTSFLHGLNNVGDNVSLKGQFYAYMGDVYYSLDSVDKAFDCYESALKVDENNIVVLNNYSYYLSLENSNLSKAEKMITKCVELEPGNATYLDTYAWVLFKRGRYFEAKYIIERAIDNGGTESQEIIEHYGDILFKNGDIVKALEQWKLSKELGNDSSILLKKIELKNYVEE